MKYQWFEKTFFFRFCMKTANLEKTCCEQLNHSTAEPLISSFAIDSLFLKKLWFVWKKHSIVGIFQCYLEVFWWLLRRFHCVSDSVIEINKDFFRKIIVSFTRCTVEKLSFYVYGVLYTLCALTSLSSRIFTRTVSN